MAQWSKLIQGTEIGVKYCILAFLWVNLVETLCWSRSVEICGGLRRSVEVSGGLSRTFKVCGGLWRSFKVCQGVSRCVRECRGVSSCVEVWWGVEVCWGLSRFCQGLSRPVKNSRDVLMCVEVTGLQNGNSSGLKCLGRTLWGLIPWYIPFMKIWK